MKRIFSQILAFALILSLAAPASAAPLLSIYFTDKDTGTSMRMPSGWTHKTQGNTVYFSGAEGETEALMTYASTDLWGDLPADTRVRLSRQDYCNSLFSREDIAETMDTTAGNVCIVTLGGYSYFRVDTEHTTVSGGYQFTIPVTSWLRMENGWLYMYQFAGGSGHEQFRKFVGMISSASYSDPGKTAYESAGIVDQDAAYAEGVRLYNSGNYTYARRAFQSCVNNADSQKYLRLIRIRQSGGNLGVGSAIFDSSKKLTDSQKRDIDKAAEDFRFADTAEVLLCNSDVACYYLVGDWNGGPYCYIKFRMNNYGGTYEGIGSKLSTNYQSTFSINDGILRVDVPGTNALTLKLTLTGPDTMQVLTYEKGCTEYTLTR